MTRFTRRTFNQVKQQITGYTDLAKQSLDRGYQGYLMTLMFNQLPGNDRQKNNQMQSQTEGLFASLLTRIIRRPRHSLDHPKLIGCPDWPVSKHDKMQLSDIITNGGLHY